MSYVGAILYSRPPHGIKRNSLWINMSISTVLMLAACT